MSQSRCASGHVRSRYWESRRSMALPRNTMLHQSICYQQPFKALASRIKSARGESMTSELEINRASHVRSTSPPGSGRACTGDSDARTTGSHHHESVVRGRTRARRCSFVHHSDSLSFVTLSPKVCLEQSTGGDPRNSRSSVPLVRNDNDITHRRVDSHDSASSCVRFSKPNNAIHSPRLCSQ